MDMFFSLSNLSGHDAHTLWHASSQNPNPYLPPFADSLNDNPDAQARAAAEIGGAQPAFLRRSHQSMIDNSALGRLAAEERMIVRRCHAVADFGSTWLKPPAITKTLSQRREEIREQQEHAEAQRREQLQQELAQAEAEAEAEQMEDQDMNEDGQEEVQPDLDDEIPDADAEGSGFQFSYIDNDEEEEEVSEEEEEEEVEEEDGHDFAEAYENDSENDEAALETPANRTRIGNQSLRTPLSASTPDQTLREQRQNDLLAARMREAAVRRAMLQRGGDTEPIDDFYGDGTSFAADQYDDDDADQGEVLGEEDFGDSAADMLLMERDLDDDVPEADELSGGYEHTDSEAVLLESSEDDEEDLSDEDDEHDHSQFSRFARRAIAPPTSPTMGTRGSNRLYRADVSDFLAPHQESSILESSPPMRRAARQP